MEMEVMMPSPAVDFNFDSACTSPYMTAPSSPQRFGNFFFSAPTSPTRASSFFRDFNDFSVSSATTSLGASSTVPFNWEEKPGIPKTKGAVNFHDDSDADFEFDFSGQLERTSLSADELFDGGKIKPLKPPPRLQLNEHGVPDSPKSPRSPIGSKRFKEALSPRQRKKDFDPFAAAMEQARKQSNSRREEQERGRERTYDSSQSRSRHKGTRSLSPCSVSDILFESDHSHQNASSSTANASKQSSSSSSFSNLALTWIGYRKWKLKDLLLFRSASEGRATTSGGEPLKKYALLKKSSVDDVKNASFRSTDSSGSVSSSRRRGPVSAHELHYTANRAVSEEMKKKTFLPYKQGLLGCLGFNPAVHEISKGVGSMTRG